MRWEILSRLLLLHRRQLLRSASEVVLLLTCTPYSVLPGDITLLRSTVYTNLDSYKALFVIINIL